MSAGTIEVSRRHPPYCLCWLNNENVHRVMNDQKRKSSSNYERIKNKPGDSALVQSKGTKTICIHAIRIIYMYHAANI
jgi:hypothetical protein